MEITKETYNRLKDVIATYIGSEVLKGVHYYNILFGEKKKMNQINELNNLFIGEGEGLKGTIELIPKDEDSRKEQGTTVIFNEDFCEKVAMIMLKEIGEKNKKIKGIDKYVDIEKQKNEECKRLAKQVVKERRQFDIYLYKVRGSKVKSFAIKEGNKQYIKEIEGYRLTERDIANVNRYASEEGYKIVSITPNEMLDADYGRRYTIEVGQADFIEES